MATAGIDGTILAQVRQTLEETTLAAGPGRCGARRFGGSGVGADCVER